MNTQETLIYLFKYFSKFVPKDVLQKMFVKSKDTQSGYNEIVAEVMSTSSECVISDIDAYIFSSNEEFLSKKVKNSRKNVLYVEYGAVAYTPNSILGLQQKLGIHVATPYSASNNDNLNEILYMDKQQCILLSILDQMEKDQKDLNFCGETELVKFPAEIVAIEPRLFYDRAGWMGIFDYSTTNIL